MSGLPFWLIRCDHGPPACLEYVNIAARALTEARKGASTAGWTYRMGRDWCPEHEVWPWNEAVARSLHPSSVAVDDCHRCGPLHGQPHYEFCAKADDVPITKKGSK